MNKITGPLLKTEKIDEIETKVVPSLEKRRVHSYIAMMALDAAIVHLAFVTAAFVYDGFWWQNQSLIAAQTILPLYFTIALYNRSYGARALADWIYAARQAVTSLFMSAALVSFVAFYTKSSAQFSRVGVTLGLLFTAIALVASRWLIIRLIDHFWQGKTRNFLIIQDEGPEFALATADVISARQYDIDPAADDPHVLDRLGKLLRNRDKVIVSCSPERRNQWAFRLKSFGVHCEIVSEPARELGALGVQRYENPDRTTLVVSTGPLSLRGRAMKRAFDVFAASCGLILLSPLLLAVAIAIKVTDGGPVLFFQERTGRGNQFFRLLKFRSMRMDGLDASGVRSTARHDDRVTPIGAFIRRTSIDEIPQLINVLRGEMSIVGPRPHAAASQAEKRYFWQIHELYWQRHCLKPGLTGLAQVRGHRGATEQTKDLTDRVQSDLEYIAGWSLMRDFRIILKTLRVLTHDKAY
ncbi:exopolysaccharide biosynthesis polyprenyl glycosylphosphotransferase [Erythrobacter rubeus]|uniref:Exopolysaccharide biosynthesis polyprenyl glycosylphosphotransferase n=1 Tax=Erythrobacter rubeus TaxID=2760803 RepID=A0ABR8KQM3_9SPHN|nr:exopolysaccharide biosynthesis polyprenyl glycosylphosphotransferase [Erythrobacter rubeus]MBD2843047.1 exopolysaccharide biosynthesis polyprenyl glycosylphosphotransferase [Erythrobacter rubeus]